MSPAAADAAAGSRDVRSLLAGAWLEPEVPRLRTRIVEIALGRREQSVIVTTSVVRHAASSGTGWKRCRRKAASNNGDGTVTQEAIKFSMRVTGLTSSRTGEGCHLEKHPTSWKTDQVGRWNQRPQASRRMRQSRAAERHSCLTLPGGGEHGSESAAKADINGKLRTLADKRGSGDCHKRSAPNRSAGPAGIARPGGFTWPCKAVARLFDGTVACRPAYRAMADKPGQRASGHCHFIAPAA